MRQPCLYPIAHLVESDEAAGVRLLDRGRFGYPGERPEFDRFTDGEGVDVVLDMIGAPYVERNIRVLRRDGRLVFVAFQQGNRCELDLWQVMSKRLCITGSTMRPRSVAEKAAIRDALAQHIWPMLAADPARTHLHATFPWQQSADAHRLMESSLHIGKIVLAVRP